MSDHSVLSAAEGAAYHSIAATALLNDCSAAQAIELNGNSTIYVDGFEIKITEDDLAHVDTYLEAVRRLPGTRMAALDAATDAAIDAARKGGKP